MSVNAGKVVCKPSRISTALHRHVLFHLPLLRSLWKGVCHPLHRSTSSSFKSLSCSCQRSSAVKKMVYWESIGLSGIRRDPPYAYYLLAACSLPFMVDYVRVSWYSLSRAFRNAGSSFQSQSIPAFRSSAGAGVHLDCTGSSVLPALAGDSSWPSPGATHTDCTSAAFSPRAACSQSLC